ncbi:Retinoic acid induced 16-like protein-domain-containing protein [Gorgonomyces haynaldii]|nr:Retinoic acid induced 16-like protein-domain-containing protein [Gorgonomyces haynaldii]
MELLVEKLAQQLTPRQNESPQMRLKKFRSKWDTILQESRRDHSQVRSILQTEIPYLLESMAKRLLNDNSETEMGLCTEFLLSVDLLDTLVTISQYDEPKGYQYHVVLFTSAVLEALPSQLLFNKSINGPLLKLLKFVRQAGHSETEAELVELEYTLIQRIYDLQELKPIFFEDDAPFAMFDHLLKFVHLDTEAGEYARCGVVLLSQMSEFEDHIAKSNLPTIIDNALSSFFSQFSVLPSNLGDKTKRRKKAFEKQVKGFDAVFQFCQSLLRGHLGDKIYQVVAYGFYDTVLVNAITSSMSDFDGTTMSTLYYVRHIVETTKEKRLGEKIVTLLTEPNKEDDVLKPRDVIMSKLQSVSEHVVVSCLMLLESLIQYFPQSVPLLVEKCRPLDMSRLSFAQSDNVMDVGQHFQILSKYYEIMPSSMDPGSMTLDAYLQDAQDKFQIQDKPQLSHQDFDGNPVERLSSQKRQELKYKQDSLTLQHHLELSHDRFLRILLGKLVGFFGQSMHINIAITGVLTQLMTSPYHHLYLYLVHGDCVLEDPDQKNYCLYSILLSLLDEVQGHRVSIDSFDDRLYEKKQQLYHRHKPSLFGWMDPMQLFRTDNDMTLDEEARLLANTVVLHEFVKEVFSTVLMRGAAPFCHLSYL